MSIKQQARIPAYMCRAGRGHSSEWVISRAGTLTPQKRPGYGAASDQNTCTLKSPLDGSGSP
jgi:hypothetical protein